MSRFSAVAGAGCASLLAVGVVWAACGSPTTPQAEVDFELDQASYALGDTALLTLTNRGSKGIGPGSILQCSLYLERRAGEAWQSTPRPPQDEACIEGWLAPGGIIERKLPITSDLFEAGGTYRFRIEYAQLSDPTLYESYSPVFFIEGN